MDKGYGTYGGRSLSGRSWSGRSAGPKAPRTEDPTGYSKSPDAIWRPGSGEHSILRSGGLGEQPGTVDIWELVLVPWLLQVLILVCFLLAGAHGKTHVLWEIPIVTLVLATWFTRHHYKKEDNVEVVLGLLCLTAICMGTLVGVYSNLEYLQEYYRLTQGASYYNVLPSEPALGKNDATTLVFTSSSRVDSHRTYGFVDATSANGDTYCVAPVASAEDSATQMRRIQYWAVGFDCCEQRGSFQCGAAGSESAHGAIVLPEETQEDRAFKAAIRGAEAAYGLLSGQEHLLVRWVEDPIRSRDGLWSGTVILYLIFGGVYLMISSMVGVALRPVLTVQSSNLLR
mmetsp:Transcript_110266/g.235489  ORF Transcript_110266/g.235489 Transcript_110266/m.235489 type:complete len:342 (-) Transcript_110266:34-1059(-)